MNQPPPLGRALTAGDIAEYLKTPDDFAFEREVYDVAHKLGFEAEHAALYSDPVTRKQREFDIRASYTLQDNKIALAIECKGLTTDYPLLVSCVPRARSEDAAIVYIPATSVFSRIRAVLSECHPCIYPAGQGVGKSMRQVKRET